MTEQLACPLSWPATWSRTEFPRRSAFQVTFAQARDGLLSELRMLGAREVLISSNVALRRDGLPYAAAKDPDDAGVAVYFELDGQPKCIPVDKWDRVKDNLRAVELTVAALRGLERWGAKHMVDAAFQGFAALPAGGTREADPWWVVLGVRANDPRPIIESAYRRLARKHHPDLAGKDNHEQWLVIQKAWEQAMRSTV